MTNSKKKIFIRTMDLFDDILTFCLLFEYGCFEQKKKKISVYKTDQVKIKQQQKSFIFQIS